MPQFEVVFRPYRSQVFTFRWVRSYPTLRALLMDLPDLVEREYPAGEVERVRQVEEVRR